MVSGRGGWWTGGLLERGSPRGRGNGGVAGSHGQVKTALCRPGESPSPCWALLSWPPAEGGSGERGPARWRGWPPGRAARQAGQAAQVIPSQGELRQGGLGGHGPPQVARAFPESQAGRAGRAASTCRGHSGPRSEQDRAGTQDRGVPSRHFTHCSSLSSRSQERLWPGVLGPEPEPRGPENEREGSAVRGQPRRDVIWGAVAAGQARRDTRSREAARAQPVDASPTQHCGPGATREGPSALGDTGDT